MCALCYERLDAPIICARNVCECAHYVMSVWTRSAGPQLVHHGSDAARPHAHYALMHNLVDVLISKPLDALIIRVSKEHVDMCAGATGPAAARPHGVGSGGGRRDRQRRRRMRRVGAGAGRG
jgi:hypothetical protein